MSQKLPVNNFEWIEKTSQFNGDLKKINNEESYEGYFLKVEVEYQKKKTKNFIMTYHFYHKERNLKKWKSL